MSMSRKHYVAIAAVLKDWRIEDLDLGGAVSDDIAKDLAKLFKQDNIHFDRERFLNACGVEA